MHGVFITGGVSDWQIVQHTNGYATLSFSGTWQVPKAAIEIGVKRAVPLIRVMRQDDNSQVVPWTETDYSYGSDPYHGTWTSELRVPAGGLYRIETGLDTRSVNPKFRWVFRGDIRVHIGVGDIFVIAGQSNSSGYGRDWAQDAPMPGIHMYRNRGKWDLACHPINESTYASDRVNAEMGICGVSPYLSFGKCFSGFSRFPVGLIPTALGGSPISRWHSGQNGDLFRNMIDRINQCGGKAAGILWYQGCSDATPELAPNYYENFRHLVFTTREALGYEIPFFTFQLNRQIGGLHDECWGMVREAQRMASHKIPGVYILPTMDCRLSDGIHNSAHANIQLGERMARLCADVLYGMPGYRAPEPESVICDNQRMSLTFKNMKRGFTLFSNDPGYCGFTVEDRLGKIAVTALEQDGEKPNVLHLALERAPLPDAAISFCWEADPTVYPPVDEVTCLPILSFYQLRLNQLSGGIDDEK